MREKIIFAPGANGNEIMKSLALHGINLMNVKVCGAGELARRALMCSGIAITQDFLSVREEIPLIAEAVNGELYFGKPTYSDIRKITAAVRKMRCMTADEKESEKIHEVMSKGVFSKKNEALVHVYDKYMEILKQKKSIDSVSLVRMAIGANCRIDAEFCVLEEYPLNPLETALLQKVSFDGTCSVWKKISLRDLYETVEKPVHFESIKNCYGAPNEVEMILQEIYRDNSVDKCVVAVTDVATYGQLFFDHAVLYDLPVTFGCGIPIINSNPAKLLKLYHHWMTDGMFSAASLMEMLNSSAFNRAAFRERFQDLLPEMVSDPEEKFPWQKFYGVLGSLRLTNDRDQNRSKIDVFQRAVEAEIANLSEDEKDTGEVLRKRDYIPMIEIAARELALQPEDFIVKYSYIRKGSGSALEELVMKLDLAASAAIYGEFSVMRDSGIRQEDDDFIRYVLSTSVHTGGSEAGKLYVTSVDGALGTVRDNLYIAGLSASKYPGAPRENHLLLDADLQLFGDDMSLFTSEGKVRNRRETLLSLVRLYASCGAKMQVSYSGLNVSELKNDNASSMIYELFKEEHGQNVGSKDLEEGITKVAYFEPAVSVTREIGKAYDRGDKVIAEGKNNRMEHLVPGDLDIAYSPSALNLFFGCPRRFLLGHILHIPEPEEDKPFEVISAIDSGLLAHTLMERLANTGMSRPEFMRLSEEAFDRYIGQNPPLVSEKVDDERENFLDMMSISFNMDQGREVILKEEDIECTHSSGVRIHGYPDRVEKLPNGKILIVDYKTGRTIEHLENDINTCLQIVIYAYLMEQQGFEVDGGQFRYIRLGETVNCIYDDDMKQLLNDKLKQFKAAMESGKFPLPEFVDPADNGPCKYCKFGHICGKM